MNDKDVAAVRAVIEERVAAIAAGDAVRANAVLAEDIVAFEMAPPLAHTSSTVRDSAALSAWLRTWAGPISIAIRDMEIAVAGDVAFAYAFHHLEGTRSNGETVSFWFRSTLCFRKRAGRWLIVHGHSSVPFDPEREMRAALDLRP
jgi:ketosteroid isomerase-like protein